MTERKFPEGIRIFPPNDKAPSFVKGTVIITLEDLTKFWNENKDLISEYKGKGQLRLQLAERKDGKGLNLTVDTYKREASGEPDLPF